jgi:hypothetical protein
MYLRDWDASNNVICSHTVDLERLEKKEHNDE